MIVNEMAAKGDLERAAQSSASRAPVPKKIRHRNAIYAPLTIILLLLLAVRVDCQDRLFQQKVSNALSKVQSLLESTKSPRRILNPSDIEHAYDDKYSLVEFITNTAIASTANALHRLGLTSQTLKELKFNETVQLRFVSNETCEFLEEKVERMEDPSSSKTEEVVETYETSASGDARKVDTKTTTSTARAVREVTEYYWKYNLSYELMLVTGRGRSGSENAQTKTIQSRSGSEIIVVTGSERAPCQSHHSPPPLEIDLGWFIEQLDGENANAEDALQSQFRIDRDAPSCKTPRRNDDVEGAARHFERWQQWGYRLSSYFVNTVASRLLSRGTYGGRGRSSPSEGGVQTTGQKDRDGRINLIRSIDDSSIFVPVVPLFQEDASVNDTDPSLSSADTSVLLREQCHTLDNAVAVLHERFPSAETLGMFSSAEASLILVTKHLSTIATSFHRGIAYVEEMLRSQLISAVGREINSNDFDEFIKSYYPKLFKEEYVPESFVYAVRRPNHYPDGTISFEMAGSSGGVNAFGGGGAGSNGGGYDPILTFTQKLDNPKPMNMPINAATNIALAGDQYVHAWIRTEFGSSAGPGPRLVARARQFSSFLLCIGTIAGPQTFQPKHAIILSNKDELIVPLLLEALPTPKEFRDAIKSLSPEQRDFAQAFRTMQLESSVFAVAIVQLKPQLESVLQLPYTSLTKEIQLTQNLLELFIEYQIPPDLLSYDGDTSKEVEGKLGRVKEHVAAVRTMIEEAKEREVKEAERQAELKEAARKAELKAQEENRRMRRSRQPMYADDMMMADEAMPQMMMMAAEAMPEMMVMEDAMPDSMEVPPVRARSLHAASADSSSMPKRSLNKHNLRATEAGPSSAPSSTPDTDGGVPSTDDVGNTINFSHIAKKLDAAFDEFDVDSALRPTKILTLDSTPWEKRYHKTLLTPQEVKSISQDEKKRETNKAFDLLDALSKSGAEAIRYSELHVIVAATHRFDESLIDTVIRSNANPITSVERSALIVSSTIHDVPVKGLVVGQGRLAAVGEHSPGLLGMGMGELESGDGDGFAGDTVASSTV